jgi:23S rRNA (uracil1939-C5)-methyltransferase
MSWQHIRYDAQLRFKHAIVRDQLHKFLRPVVGGGEAAKVADSAPEAKNAVQHHPLDQLDIRDPIPAHSPWGYRNTIHLRHDPQTGYIGYYAVQSRRVVDLPFDPLALPAINEALAGLRTVLSSQSPNDCSLTHITIRASATYGYVIGSLSGANLADVRSIAHQWRAHCPALAGCMVTEESESGGEVGGESRKRKGIRESMTTDENSVLLHEQLEEVTFSISPESFFQVHTAQAESMLQVVRSLLALHPHERLLDLYSGVGTFALPLARDVAEVVAVESHPRAVEDGRRSQTLNAIPNVTFHHAPAEQAMSFLAKERHTPPSYAAAILDPPRRGCHPAVLQTMIELAVPRLLYISCHPGVLARDLDILCAGGYRPVTIQPIDMFPQTPHIESVVLLCRYKLVAIPM